MTVIMADNHTPQERSFNMSRIRSVNNKLEEMTRKYLFSRGLRYRKNSTKLPGHPDIMLPKYHTVVFINGCFWHMHSNCKRSVLPQTNSEYWLPKLEKNRERDRVVKIALEQAGWNVIVIWECELKRDIAENRLEKLYEEIIMNLGETPQC
jgi:DNA mismatch endonuclease (patch repair protein)